MKKLGIQLKYDLSRLKSILSSSLEIKYIIYQGSFIFLLTTAWALMFVAFYATLDPFTPRHANPARTPGMSFRARSDNIYSTLIRFKHGGSGNWQPIVERFMDFIKVNTPSRKIQLAMLFSNMVSGKDLEGLLNAIGKLKLIETQVGPKKWAAYDTDIECTKPEKFGMYHGKPCIMVKLNRVYGWEPEPYYNTTEIMELPKMPTSLKEHIMNIWTKNCKGKGQAKEEKCPQLRMVWVSCGGETAADEENLGRVSYTPWRGFPGFYYPYLNQMHYLSPIVWLQFRNITPGVIIQIRCKAWAKNIKHDDLNPRIGGVHFEMLMD